MPYQSLTALMSPVPKTSHLRLLWTGRDHRQGWSSCGYHSFSSPPAPACSSDPSSFQVDGLGVWRGSLELCLLEDSLVGPSWISAPFSQRQGSHDYCGHSGGLCSEMKGWQENLRVGGELIYRTKERI